MHVLDSVRNNKYIGKYEIHGYDLCAAIDFRHKFTLLLESKQLL